MSDLTQMVIFSQGLHSPSVDVTMIQGEPVHTPHQTFDIRKISLTRDEAQELYEELGGVITAIDNTPDFEPADAREEALDLRNEVA